MPAERRDKMKKAKQRMLFFLFLLFLSAMISCTEKAEKIVFYQTQDMNTVSEAISQTVCETVREAQQSNDAAGKICETAVQTITVYLCGEVKQPGVYILENGSRLYQAIEAAGGLTDEAQAEAVNLARVLSDSEQIRIPNVSETTASSIPQTADILPSSGAESSGSSLQTGLVNINQASVSELMQLPGIGQVKAEAIVQYRTSNGSFASIDEIKNVPGIKEAAFEKIKGMITVF